MSRRRQVRTVFTLMPSSAAIAVFGRPSAASNTISARFAIRCGLEGHEAIRATWRRRLRPRMIRSMLTGAAIAILHP